VQAELPESVIRPIVLAACAFMFLNVTGRLDASAAWGSQLVAVIVAFTIGTILLIRRIPPHIKKSTLTNEHKLWLTTSMPMLLMSSMNVVLNQASVIILGFYRSPEEIAIFSAASRIVILATFILMAINSIAAPMISELFHSNKKDELQSLLAFSAKGIAVFTALTTLFLFFVGRFILGLFGQEFVAGYPILIMLLVGQTIKSLMGPASFLLNLTGYQNLTAKVMTLAVLISVVLNFLLIPRWGVMGAAIASGATMALWNVVLVILDRRIVKLDPSILYFIKGVK
jgi:O-antigen/teichoic acid export membrane protein